MASPTPILDLEEPFTGRVPRAPVIGGLLGLAIGIAFGLGNSFYPGDVNSSWYVTMPVVMMLFPFGAYLISVYVHESGHLLAARTMGLKIQSINLWPFQIVRSQTGFKFRINWTLAKGETGFEGSVSAEVPPDLPRVKWVVFVGGGSLLNLLLAGVAVLLAYLTSPNGGTILTYFSVVIACISGAMGILNLAPFEAGLPSDGSNLWMLIENGKRLRRRRALLKVNHLRETGCSLEDIPMELVYEMISPGYENCASAFPLAFKAYLCLSARDLHENAGQCLEQCLRSVYHKNRALRDILISEAATYQAWQRRNLDKASEWHSRLGKRKLPGRLGPRLDAAMACAASDFESALKIVDECIASFSSNPESQKKSEHIAGWQKWRQQIEERKTAHSLATTSASS